MIRFGLIACLAVTCLRAAEKRGTVEFGGLPVPGAVVTATRDGQTFSTITDERGTYVFPDLADGTWTM
ncbi:MAG TPA: carboxypeptidase-like regulatory domain-containing protein, partial [Bryobacteraceae bacterium]|nr:carboxypeptidase-like regulatory domain-containing protein [Bryobacteraceae bacterium]